MLRFGLFYIYGILCVAGVDVRFSKHEGNDISVNLALDTVVEFDNQGNGANVKFIDNVQRFLGKVKTIIEKKNLRRSFTSGTNKKITGFVQNLIQILVKFKDSDLENVFTVLSEEMKKYHYKGCKFHELIENYKFRTFLCRQLDEMKHAPADTIRRNLKASENKIEEEKYNQHEKELIEFVNSLYGPSSYTLFNKVLENFKNYKAKKGTNLSKIISKAVKSLIFDYCTELNRNARTALKFKLDEFYASAESDTTVTNPHTKITRRIISTKNNMISTYKMKYVQQYLDLKNNVFKYSRQSSSKSGLSYDSSTYKSDTTDVVKPTYKRAIPNFNSNKRNTITIRTSLETESYDESGDYKQSESKKKMKQAYKTIHRIRSSVEDDEESQSRRLKEYTKTTRMTPKQPDIESNHFESIESNIFHDSKREEDKKSQIRKKASSDHTNQKCGEKPKLEYDKRKKDYKNKLYNKLKHFHKLNIARNTDKYSDEKLVSHIFNKSESVERLVMNGTDGEPTLQKTKSWSKLSKLDNTVDASFDSVQGIRKAVNDKNKPELKSRLRKTDVTFKKKVERKTQKITSKRNKGKKLTFLTLYPEFIDHWATAMMNESSHMVKKRITTNIDQIYRKISTKHHFQTIYYKRIMNISNPSYKERLRSVSNETSFKNHDGHFTKQYFDHKVKGNRIHSWDKEEFDDNKQIKRILANEKLKGIRNPVGLGENLSTKELEASEIKSRYQQEINRNNIHNNHNRRIFFIDLNYTISPNTEINYINDGRKNGAIQSKNGNRKSHRQANHHLDSHHEKRHKKFISLENVSKENTNNIYVKKYKSVHEKESANNRNMEEVVNYKSYLASHMKRAHEYSDSNKSATYSIISDLTKITDRVPYYPNKFKGIKSRNANKTSIHPNSNVVNVNLTKLNRSSKLGVKYDRRKEDEGKNINIEYNKKVYYNPRYGILYKDRDETTQTKKKMSMSCVHDEGNSNEYDLLDLQKAITTKVINYGINTARIPVDKNNKYDYTTRSSAKVSKNIQEKSVKDKASIERLMTGIKNNANDLKTLIQDRMALRSVKFINALPKKEQIIEETQEDKIEDSRLKNLNGDLVFNKTKLHTFEKAEAKNDHKTNSIENKLGLSKGDLRITTKKYTETLKVTEHTEINPNITKRRGFNFSETNIKPTNSVGMIQTFQNIDKSSAIYPKATAMTITRKNIDGSFKNESNQTTTSETKIDKDQLTALTSSALNSNTEPNFGSEFIRTTEASSLGSKSDTTNIVRALEFQMTANTLNTYNIVTSYSANNKI